MADNALADSIGELYEASVAEGVFAAIDKAFGSNTEYKRFMTSFPGVSAESLATGTKTSQGAVNARKAAAEIAFNKIIAVGQAQPKDRTIINAAAADGATKILATLRKKMPKSPEDVNLNILLGEVGGNSPYGDMFAALLPSGSLDAVKTQILELKMYGNIESDVKYWKTSDKAIWNDNTFWRYLAAAGDAGEIPWWGHNGIPNGTEWRKAIGKKEIWANYLLSKTKTVPNMLKQFKTKFGASSGGKTIIRGYKTGDTGASIAISMERMMQNITYQNLFYTKNKWSGAIFGYTREPAGQASKKIGIFNIAAETQYLATAYQKGLTRNTDKKTTMEVSIPSTYFKYALQKGGLYI